MEVRIYIQPPALHDYVLNISTVNAVLPEGVDEVVTPYPPTPFQSLIFYCSDPVFMSRVGTDDFQQQPISVLLGQQISRVNIKVKRRLCAIRVDFLPGGVFRMLGIPMHELFDEGFNSLDFFGPAMKTINEQLQEITSLEEGKTLVENFLIKQVADSRDILPFDHAMRMLLNNSGNMAIEKVASISCLSTRQFERKCHERIGMNPKLYARILKFSKAYRMHESRPELSWIKIAHEAGYYDQMHMIRDFKVFAGVNPSVIETQLLSTPLRMQKDLPR